MDAQVGGNQGDRRGLQVGSGLKILINSHRNLMESIKMKQTTKGRGKTEMTRHRPIQTEMVGRILRRSEMLALWCLPSTIPPFSAGRAADMIGCPSND